MAAAFMSATNNQVYKEVLVDYFADVILTNPKDWNKWRKEIPEIKLYLQELKIDCFFNIGIDLSNTNLTNSSLSSCYLFDFNFDRADLSQANLSHSIFAGAELKQTKFVGANLEGANFERSELIEVDFEKANLQEVNLAFCKS